MVFVSCLSGENNRELAVLAVTTAAALAQEYSQEEVGRLAAFFTILGVRWLCLGWGRESVNRFPPG